MIHLIAPQSLTHLIKGKHDRWASAKRWSQMFKGLRFPRCENPRFKGPTTEQVETGMKRWTPRLLGGALSHTLMPWGDFVLPSDRKTLLQKKLGNNEPDLDRRCDIHAATHHIAASHRFARPLPPGTPSPAMCGHVASSCARVFWRGGAPLPSGKGPVPGGSLSSKASTEDGSLLRQPTVVAVQLMSVPMDET